MNLLNHDNILLISSFLHEFSDLFSFLSTCKSVYQVSLTKDFWKNSTFSSHKKIPLFLNDFFKYFQENGFSMNQLHSSILLDSIPKLKSLHIFGYNFFTRSELLEYTKLENSIEIFKNLDSIGYPLNELYFQTLDPIAKPFIGNRNFFTLLHFIVWQENVELCKFMVDKKILDQRLDSLKMTPFIYSCHLGNEDLCKILLPEKLEYNEEYIGDIILQSIKDYPDVYNVIKDLIISLKEKDEIEYQSIDEISSQKRDDQIVQLLSLPPNSTIYINNEKLYIDHSDFDLEIEGFDSDSNPKENGIKTDFIFKSDENEIQEKASLFEEVWAYEDNNKIYNYYPYTKTRILKKRIRDSEEDDSRKRTKIDFEGIGDRIDFTFSKYSFRFLVNEIGNDFKTDLHFTYLSHFILQDSAEKYLIEYFEMVSNLQFMGVPLNNVMKMIKVLMNDGFPNNFDPIEDSEFKITDSELAIDSSESSESEESEESKESEIELSQPKDVSTEMKKPLLEIPFNKEDLIEDDIEIEIKSEERNESDTESSEEDEPFLKNIEEKTINEIEDKITELKDQRDYSCHETEDFCKVYDDDLEEFEEREF